MSEWNWWEHEVKWNQFTYKRYLPFSEAYSLTFHRCPVTKRHDGSKSEKVSEGTTFTESLYSKTSNFTGRCSRLSSETCFLSRERGNGSYFVTIFILFILYWEVHLPIMWTSGAFCRKRVSLLIRTFWSNQQICVTQREAPQIMAIFFSSETMHSLQAEGLSFLKIVPAVQSGFHKICYFKNSRGLWRKKEIPKKEIDYFSSSG